MQDKNKMPLVLGVVAVIVVLGAMVFIMNRPSPTPPPSVPPPAALPTAASQPVADATPSLPAALPATQEIIVAASTPVEVAANEPTYTPKVDVELQPRAFAMNDFRNLTELPEGFTAENLVLTENGLALKPPEPGEEDKPRMGMLESPPQDLDFPSNAVAPLWMEKVPDGGHLFVEMSVSPDGENWSLWDAVEVDDDSVGQIAEFYPDGKPNPNFGYTPGGLLFWGHRQYLYYRYRVTLYSETQSSPLLSAFRVFYQDSTLGEGHIAQPQERGSGEQP